MDERQTSLMRGALRGGVFSRGKLGNIDASVVESVISASGDVAMVIDRDGVICDMALTSDEMARDGVGSWLDQRWTDTVTLESRRKVEELLRDARQDGRTLWREVNQFTPIVNSLIVKFIAISIMRDDTVIAIGRDDRINAVLQQKLIESQRTTERDYTRLRDVESRYNAIFQSSGEGLLIVDVTAKKIVDLNPLAEILLVSGKDALVGEHFSRVFDGESQDQASSLLIVCRSSPPGNCPTFQLIKNGKSFSANAVLFRQFRATYYLVRLSPAGEHDWHVLDNTPDLSPLIDVFPESFIITDRSLKILVVNNACLDLFRVATKGQLVGQDLSNFIGRIGIDRDMILDNLRSHGAINRYSTIIRVANGSQEEVEISGVTSNAGGEARYGFAIRVTHLASSDGARPTSIQRHSVEQLADLVGRVKLKELVRESSDLIENLAIQAALELTNDNRASAAEVLGLSRQSLYSKMRRFGLGNLPDGEI